MALTRTRFFQSNTFIAKIQDPITVINSESSLANTDIGFVLNRSGGITSNVALYWNESGNTFVLAVTNDSGVLQSNINPLYYSNLRVGGLITNTLSTTTSLSVPGLTVVGDATVTGNLTVQGNTFSVGTTDLVVQDSIIRIHSFANGSPLLSNDGRDIGLALNYYDSQNAYGFLGRINSTGYLEYLARSTEGSGNVVTGTYGVFKTGELRLANTTASIDTTTGALVVDGGAGIAGNLNVGGIGSALTVYGNLTMLGQYLNTGSTVYPFFNANVVNYHPTANTVNISTSGRLQATLGSSLFSNQWMKLDSITNGTYSLYTGLTTGIFELLPNLTTGIVSIGSTGQGNAYVAFTTNSISTNSGALTVAGGVGVLGNVYADKYFATNGVYWAGNGAPFSSVATAGAAGDIQYNTGTNLGASSLWYDSGTGNIVVNVATASTSTTTGALVVKGGLGVAGNIFASGINGTIYGQLNIGTTAVNYDRASAPLSLTGVSIDGTATTATNAINTQITSNIASGIAYPTFVSSTSGNAAQQVNTALTYNPNTGNLRTYTALIDTDLIVGGNLTVQNISYTNQEIITTTEIIQGNLVANSGVDSTSNVTGAMVVRGGIGVSGNIHTKTLYTQDGIRWAGNGNVFASGSGAGLTYTANTAPPISGNIAGDQWYNTITDVLYEYLDNGTKKYWVDVQSPILFANTSTTVNVLGETTVTGNLVPSANITYNIGSVTNWWGTYFGVATQAKYADLAENYQADAAYEPGTVLEFGGTNEVTIAEDGTRRVAGVVSTNPAHLMNSALTGENVVAIALQGRTPCRVRGKISKGDMLISGGAGFARPDNSPQLGAVIGKSLEDFDGFEGVIEVVVGRL